MQETTYTLPAGLVQAIASLLGEMPAVRSRALLNALESTCVQQDQERQNLEIENQIAARLVKAKA